MKLFLISSLVLAIFCSDIYAETNLYSFSANLVNGQKIQLADYQGKVVLLANTASNCGFTPQYEGLQEIYQKYQDQGLVVLAFPSNDFGGQEPGTNEEIGLFCQKTYDVTFPVFEKTVVKGDLKSPLFKFLTEDSGEDLSGNIKWNFEKFLINKDGKLVDRFGSFTKPTSESITSQIEKLLKE